MDRPGDSAELARLLHKATEGVREREAYLESLAAAIRAGRYRVDSAELARKLIDEGWPGHSTGESEVK